MSDAPRKAPARKSAPRRSKALAERLTQLVYDALSDALAVEFDPARRRGLIIRMQQILLDDGAAIIYGYPKTNMVFSNRIEGARILPADYYWITKDIRPASL